MLKQILLIITVLFITSNSWATPAIYSTLPEEFYGVAGDLNGENIGRDGEALSIGNNILITSPYKKTLGLRIGNGISFNNNNLSIGGFALNLDLPFSLPVVVPYYTAATPQSSPQEAFIGDDILSHDFNNDGILDLLVSSTMASYVELHLGVAGANLSFQSSYAFALHGFNLGNSLFSQKVGKSMTICGNNLLIGATEAWDDGGNNIVGKVYKIALTTIQTLTGQVDISTVSTQQLNPFDPNIEDGLSYSDSQFGANIECLKDLNNDGQPEIAVTAPYYSPYSFANNNYQFNLGRLYIFDGATGATLLTRDGGAEGDYLGNDLRLVELDNNSLTSELIVASVGADFTPDTGFATATGVFPQVGKVEVFAINYSNNQASLNLLKTIGPGQALNGVETFAPSAGSGFGASLAVFEDPIGNQTKGIVVGSPGINSGTGAMTVYKATSAPNYFNLLNFKISALADNKYGLGLHKLDSSGGFEKALVTGLGNQLCANPGACTFNSGGSTQKVSLDFNGQAVGYSAAMGGFTPANHAPLDLTLQVVPTGIGSSSATYNYKLKVIAEAGSIPIIFFGFTESQALFNLGLWVNPLSPYTLMLPLQQNGSENYFEFILPIPATMAGSFNGIAGILAQAASLNSDASISTSPPVAIGLPS